jgi:flagellum-specific ATP synthase
MLPRLLERAGHGARGGITGLYTVVVDGDDFNAPVADAARSILDGHVVLTRKLAGAGHYPAIDVLESKSRVRDLVVAPEHRESANSVMRLEAAYRKNEDLLLVGAYQKGSDPTVDAAVQLRRPMLEYLQQRPDEPSSFEQSRGMLMHLAGAAEQLTRRQS